MNQQQMQKIASSRINSVRKLDVTVDSLQLAVATDWSQWMNERYFVRDDVFTDAGLAQEEDWARWLTTVTAIILAGQREVQGLYIGMLTTTYPATSVRDVAFATDHFVKNVIFRDLEEQKTPFGLSEEQRTLLRAIIQLHMTHMDAPAASYERLQAMMTQWPSFMRGRIWIAQTALKTASLEELSLARMLTGISNEEHALGVARAHVRAEFERALAAARYHFKESESKRSK